MLIEFWITHSFKHLANSLPLALNTSNLQKHNCPCSAKEGWQVSLPLSLSHSLYCSFILSVCLSLFLPAEIISSVLGWQMHNKLQSAVRAEIGDGSESAVCEACYFLRTHMLFCKRIKYRAKVDSERGSRRERCV